ncbi:aspartic-type endopeptidase [Aureococcus anophagefferens]|nr:aspartic-type endopeptidase [Aureococcus anophagefferens]
MGIGTHYAHVYVGTPPQRVSVIVDTGSHHTAFPCSGCKSCGKHTDPYFDPDKSSTLRRLGCSDCVAAARCVTKTCQTYETGLFRTQKADGIMGMSMHAQTLVPTMRSANALGHNSFSLCFMHGGAMALGGVDERIHAKPMDFVPLAKNSGWFTVKMLDILLPTITFVFEGDVRVDMKADAYMEKAAGKYVPRVYLTEASGAVLGANFMQDHDVFFDAEHRRIGFATANCDYNHQSNRSR